MILFWQDSNQLELKWTFLRWMLCRVRVLLTDSHTSNIRELWLHSLAQVVVACYDKFRLQHATEWPHQASTTCILKGRFPKNGWSTPTAKFRTPKLSLRCLGRSFWLRPFRFWKWFVQLYWDGSYICLLNDLVFLTSEQMFQKISYVSHNSSSEWRVVWFAHLWY